jgi:hypothetical protein
MNKKIKLAIGIAVWVSIASNHDAALAAKNMGIKNSYQYNSDYEFGGKIIEDRGDKVLIEIRNKLSIGDTLELIVPNKLEPIEFKIEKLWNDETEEEIETVNPGRAEQKVILTIPRNQISKFEKDWILRRKK